METISDLPSKRDRVNGHTFRFFGKRFCYGVIRNKLFTLVHIEDVVCKFFQRWLWTVRRLLCCLFSTDIFRPHVVFGHLCDRERRVSSFMLPHYVVCL